MKQTVDALVERSVTKAIEGSASMRFGEVTAVDTTAKTLTVTLGGESLSSIPYMKQYAPTVGDQAWLLYQGSILVAIGCSA